MYDEILSNLQELTDRELRHLVIEIEELQKHRNRYAIIYLQYDKDYGSKRSWVAEVDQVTGEIISYLSPEKHIIRGKEREKGEKIFRLQEGKYYLINNKGNKLEQDTAYCFVQDGDLEIFNPLW